MCETEFKMFLSERADSIICRSRERRPVRLLKKLWSFHKASPNEWNVLLIDLLDFPLVFFPH